MGVPEIVLGLCKKAAVRKDDVDRQLAEYQNRAMRTLGFAYQVLEDGDITIIDNSFSSIGKAVMWGRSLYQNIQRFLLFQLTVNVTACFLVLCGAFMGTESPLTVTQMLWINLIMDTLLMSTPIPTSIREGLYKPLSRNRGWVPLLESSPYLFTCAI